MLSSDLEFLSSVGLKEGEVCGRTEEAGRCL